ncbi:MAG: GAF domain-containing protein [Fimbriimonadaceae bacterium]|nr:GAF domain-containing protein [Fimbriimonadaceae bacterium]
MKSAAALIRAQQRAVTPEKLLHEIVSTLQSVVDVSACEILVRENGDQVVLRASTYFPELVGRLRLNKSVGLTGAVICTGEPIFIPDDAQADPRYAHHPDTRNHEFRSEVILPLRNERGTYGAIVMRRRGAWPLTPPTRQYLSELGDFVGHLIEGFNQAYSAGTKQNRLGALSTVSSTIAQSPYLEEILQLLVNYTAQQFNYIVCTVRLLDEQSEELVLRATQAPAKAYQKKRAIKLGESIAGRAIATNTPIIVRDVLTDDEYIGHDLAAEQGLRSMICVPLTMQGKPIGVLSCYTNEVRDFGNDEIKALETLAKQAAVSIEHAKMQVRNTLMQEMHHRVKNNLQQVASLLRLQMRHGGYRTLEEALNDCLNRILAISAVHDLLSREDLDHVGVRGIAETLIHHQKSSFLMPNRSVRFELRGTDVHLNMTQATQLALVMNELIQNAIEHGFQEATSGEIHITVEESKSESEDREEVSVWVSNNGDPLPENFDPSVSSHLGLKIVDNLARGLGGRFKMSNVLGWTVSEVRFTRATAE